MLAYLKYRTATASIFYVEQLKSLTTGDVPAGRLQIWSVCLPNIILLLLIG